MNTFNKHLYRGVYTNGTGGHYSTDLLEVAEKTEKLTFNELYLDRSFTPSSTTTPFKEIHFAHPGEYIPDEHIRLLQNMPEISFLSSFIKQIKEALLEYFKTVLQEDQKYIVFHSAGFDSRIISLTLMHLRDNGYAHLTKNIHFRCHQPEGPMFMDIMKRQKWPENQYSVYEGPAKNYYNIGLKRHILNGWQNYNQTMNFWSDMITEEEQKDWILITGIGGELFKFLAQHKKEKNVPEITSNYKLNYLLYHYPFNGEWEGYWRRIFKDLLLPFFSYEYLSVSLRVKPEWCEFDGEKDSVRTAVVKSFIEEDGVDCYDIPYGHHDYSWNISQCRYEEMKRAYNESLFFKHRGYKAKKPDVTKLYGWDAQIWGFMTTYDFIFKNR